MDTFKPNKLLKAAREERAWTQEEVAEKIGSDSVSISRWERGTRTTNAYFQRKLVELFGKSIQELGFLNEMIEEIQEHLPSRELHESELRYPDFWNVPFQVPLFVGREDVLERLYDTLVTGKTTALTQAISGLGGIGKTMTAVRYAYKHRGEYNAILWIEADSRESFISGLIQLAHELNLPEKRLKDSNRILAAVRQWMKDSTRWLLILDNVEDIAIVHELLPTARRGHVLLTTRVQATGNAIINIELDNLTQEEGALLLLRKAAILDYTALLEEASEHNRELAMHLSSLMGGLPLALDQAGAYIREQGCSLAKYLERYQTRQVDLLKWRSPNSPDGTYAYPHSVATTWSLSFEKVSQASTSATDLLSFYVFLSPDSISEDLVTIGASELGPKLQQATDPLVFTNTLAILRNYSLVRPNVQDSTVSIHRLVQTIFKDNMNEQTREEWATRTVRAVYKTFQSFGNASFQQRDHYISHAQLCLKYIIDEHFVFIEAADLLISIGRYLRQRALYAQSEPFCVQALAIVEQMRAPLHQDRAVALANLGHLRREQGRYEEATTLYQETVHIWQQKPPRTGVETLHATSLSNLAHSFIEQGKLANAEQYAKQGVELIEQLPHAEPFEIAYCLSILARTYREQEKYKEAETLYRRALMLHEQQAEPDMIEVAHHLNNIASMRVAQGDYIASEPLNRRALALLEEHVGHDHPDVAQCLICLSDFYTLHEKDFTEATRLNQRALEIYKDRLGLEHPDILEPLFNLAILAQQQNQLEQAESFYLQALEAAEKHQDVDVSYPMFGYAGLLKQMGRPNEARLMQKRALLSQTKRKEREQALDR